MALGSLFSGLKRGIVPKRALFGLSISGTSATVGGVISYYLFRGEDNKQKIEKLNSDLKETRERFDAQIRGIKAERWVEQFALMKEQTRLEKITNCVKEEMKKHDTDWGTWGSNHTPDIAGCNNIIIRD